ncbi:MAG: Gfo/Idh/MocA family oxidoreductase [Acidobacteria bacterium]|nr:Gfo/Idh/MocA family oxidoreductase [Acidobacteriota bacterium]
MDPGICRWGILGTAGIARKNWQAIARAGNAALTAVASRSLDRGQAFVAECQRCCPVPSAPAAVGSYDELLARGDVDAVYIPLPTGVRKEWVIRAAEAGKHVLVEKPVGVTAADVRDMLAACDRHRVQLMDGVMFMHSRRLDALRRTLDDGESVGRLRRIVAQFSFNAPEGFEEENIRGDSRLEPHGCLGDLGWYTIRFALWVMRFEMPTQVTARLLAEAGRPGGPGKVPFEVSGELLFPGDVSASFYCSFRAENQQWANVSGTRGLVHIPDFVLPFFGDEVRFEVTNSAFDVQGCEFHMQRRTRSVVVPEYSNSHPTAQEANLFRTFSSLVTSGRLDPHWGEIALATQRVMDACVESAKEGRPVGLGA